MRNFAIMSVIAVSLVSCRKFKDPVFYGIENVKVGRVGGSSSEVTLDMRYLNPNSSGAEIRSAEGDAWMDTTFLGHFVVDSTVRVPANAEFLVPVKLRVDMKKLLRNSLTALLNPEVMIRLEGSARVGRSGFFKNIPIRYQGKQDISKFFSTD